MKNIVDEIYTHILDNKREFSNLELLKEFFKIESCSDEMAGKIVEPLLKPDARFTRHPNLGWTAVKKVTIEQLPANGAPFILFFIGDIEKEDQSKSGKEDGVFSVIESCSSFLLYKGGMSGDNIPIREILKNANRYIFLPYDLKSLGRLKKVYRVLSPLEPEIITLSIKSLISVLFPEKQLKTWDAIVSEFGITNYHSDIPSSKVKTLGIIFEFILNKVRERGLSTVEELVDFSLQGKKSVDFSRYEFDKDYLRSIPEMPGIYVFYNRQGDVVYVGKTNNLKIRINSYFRNTGESIEKISGILDQLSSIKYRILGSDLEALIQEYKLIDKYRPPFNKKISIPERQLDIPEKILILPSRIEGSLKLYFLSNGTPLLDIDFDCSSSGKEVDDILNKIKGSSGNVFDPLKVISLFYLRKYEESMNIIDVDRYSSHEKIINAILSHCKHLDDIMRDKTLYL
jgi:hypothetical protein